MGNMRFKVGDRVRIKDIDWYNENKDEDGIVVLSTHVFIPEMLEHCGMIVTIKDVFEDTDGNAVYYMKEIDWDWTDEMIEGLVEEETEPKFKVGDKIKLKSTLLNDIFGVIGYEPEGYRITNISNGLTYFMSYSIEHCYELVEEEAKPKFKIGDEVRIKGTDIGGTIESVIRGQLIVNSKGSKIPAWPEDVVLMKSVEEETKSENELLDEYEELTDRAFKGGYEKCQSDIELNGFQLPEGYIFKDENGNVINATKIVLEKKKKEYPNNFYHCVRTLGLYSHPADASKYKTELIRKLQTLLVCRDAYWKIAGEEMGLGKPWELSIGTPIYYIYYNRTVGTIKNDYADDIQGNIILAFPTEEMRDAFYENFKSEIEICKELL